MSEREKELVAQIMTLMAEQHYRDNHGHNHCWRNNYRLWEGIGLRPKALQLPPRPEAEYGCKIFWDQLYAEPERYPDFFPVAKEP